MALSSPKIKNCPEGTFQAQKINKEKNTLKKCPRLKTFKRELSGLKKLKKSTLKKVLQVIK